MLCIRNMGHNWCKLGKHKRKLVPKQGMFQLWGVQMNRQGHTQTDNVYNTNYDMISNGTIILKHFNDIKMAQTSYKVNIQGVFRHILVHFGLGTHHSSLWTHCKFWHTPNLAHWHAIALVYLRNISLLKCRFECEFAANIGLRGCPSICWPTTT